MVADIGTLEVPGVDNKVLVLEADRAPDPEVDSLDLDSRRLAAVP
jgi:hypothetical protein